MANEVKLKLAIEGGQVVVQSVNGVSQSLDGLDKSAKSASTGAESLKTVLAGIVTIGTAVAVINMADSVTTLRTSLNLASNSAAEASVAYDRLFTIAQQGRVSFTALGDTYATIARSGKELGVSQDRLLTVTQAIANAMTIGGGSAQSMQAALVQLGQGMSSGTLRGEELNSILEQTPRLAKALADGMGVPIGQLRSLGEQGKLTAETVISALEKSGPQLAKEMSSSTVTVGQAFTMLTNSATKFVGEADAASGASGNLAGILQGLAGIVDSVGNTINNHKEAFSAIANGLAGAAVVAGVVSLAGSIGTVTIAVKALGVAMLANPAILALTALVAAGAGLVSMANDWKQSAEGMHAQMGGINADIQLAEERARTGSEAVKARAAVEIQTLIDKRDSLRQNMAVQSQSSAENASYNAKEMKGLQAKVAAEQEAYSGSKPLDEVRKMAKLRNDILLDANDQAVNIAKSFNKAIANASSPDVAFALEKERSARLIANAAETTAALKTYDDQQAAPGKLAAKARLDTVIKYYEALQIESTAGEQRASKTLAAQHAANLVNDQAYFAKRKDLALNDNTAQQALVELEIAAVKKSGLSKQDQTAQLEKFNQDLKRLREAAKGIESAYTDSMMDLDAKWRKAQIDSDQKAQDLLVADVAKLQDANIALGLHNESIGLNAQALNNLTLKRQDAAIEIQRGIVLEYEGIEATEENTKALVKKQLEMNKLAAMEKQRALTATGQIKQLGADTFQSIFESADRTAHDVFVNIFQGGQDVFTKLRDVAKATFLDWLYQMTVKKWIFNITAMITGTSVGGMAQAGSGADGTISAAANLASMANSAMGWLTSFGSKTASMVGDLGAKMVSTGNEMLGDFGGMLINNSSAIGAAADTIGSGIGYLSAAIAASRGEWGAAVGAGIGTYFGGPIGSAIGSAIGGAIDKAFGGGSEYSIAHGVNLRASGGQLTAQNFDQWRNDGSSGFFGIGGASASAGFNYSAADSKLSAYLIGTYNALQTQTEKFAVSLGLSADSIKTYWADINVNVAGLSEADATKKMQDTFTQISQGLASGFTDALAPFKKGTETTADTLARLATDLSVVNGAMDGLGGTLFDVSVSGAAAATDLVTQAGGLDKLAASAQYLFDNFYSESEKAKMGADNLSEAFGKLGLEVPANDAAFRTLISTFDLTTASGRSLAASVAALAPAFDKVAAAAMTALQNTASAMQNWGSPTQAREAQAAVLQQRLADSGLSISIADIMASTFSDALARYNALDPNSTAAIALRTNQQAIFDFLKPTQVTPAGAGTTTDGRTPGGSGDGWSGSVSAEVDPNIAAALSLQDQLDTLTMSAMDLQKKQIAAQKLLLNASNQLLLDQITAAELAKTNAGWQERIDIATGKRTQREIALQHDLSAATDVSTQGLIKMAYAAEDLAAAAAKVDGVMQGLNSQRDNLRIQLLQAQGNTEAVAAVSRTSFLTDAFQGMDPTTQWDAMGKIANQYDANVALEAQIKQVEAANAAAQAMAQAAQSAAQAAADQAAKLKDAWSGIATSLVDEVKRIRGLMGGTSAQSYAQAQSAFAIASAQASAGDQTAAKALPQLSQAMLTLAEAQATTLLQLRSIQGQTAGTLEALGGSIASTYGIELPKFARGTNYVPQDMAAIVHKGEAIIPAAYNVQNSRQGNNEDLIQELQALRRELADLKALQSQNNDHVSETNKTLKFVTHDGRAVQFESADASSVMILGV